jgi:hypothetical protein
VGTSQTGILAGCHFSLIEYPFLQDETHNFIMGRTACIVTIPMSIVILFYTYTFILGHDSFIMDIAIFILSVIIGGIVSYMIMKSQTAFFRWNLLGIMAIIILAVLFGIFTFSPPHLLLFQDPLMGGYGIKRPCALVIDFTIFHYFS